MTTLRTYPHVDQRSEEWLALRCGMVTASVIGKLITPATLKVASNDDSRKLTDLIAAERITGYSDETPMTLDMWRGVTDEPRARDAYAEKHEVTVAEMGFMVLEGDGWRLGYSPDGLVGQDGLIEVKCPRAKGHLRTIIDDRVPAYHMAQLQTGLMVSGRKWIDFISFCGGLPLWTKRVLPDERWFAAIEQAVSMCEQAVEETVANYRESVVGLPMTERLELVVI